MIKTLQVQNFQSHAKSTLHFDPGVNVIIGPSDSGKTALLRALRWLIWNRPQGDAFRRNKGGDTEVRVQLSGGIEICRLRHDNENAYSIGGQILRSLGAGVPDEITKALNINDINLQEQMDGPFLLNRSPGEVAQHINQVAHLDQIDSSIATVSRNIRRQKNTITHYEEQLRQTETKLQQYAYVDSLQEELDEIDQWDEEAQRLQTDLAKFDNLLSNLEEINTRLSELQHMAIEIPEIDEAQALIERRDTLEQQMTHLDNLSNELADAVNTETVWYSTLNANKKRFWQAFPETCPLCGSVIVRDKEKEGDQ
jgi:exonuclease SbcC